MKIEVLDGGISIVQDGENTQLLVQQRIDRGGGLIGVTLTPSQREALKAAL